MKPSQAYVGSLKDNKKLAHVEKKETFDPWSTTACTEDEMRIELRDSDIQFTNLCSL
jgi:hypothetical protein